VLLTGGESVHSLAVHDGTVLVERADAGNCSTEAYKSVDGCKHDVVDGGVALHASTCSGTSEVSIAETSG